MRHLQIKLLNPKSKLPMRSTSGSVGYDIAACINEDIVIPPGEMQLIGSGFALALEQGHAAFIYARSGLGIMKGIVPANCVGVIDSDYRGEVKIGLKNTSKEPFTVNNGDRIAQMVIVKCELPEVILVETLDDTVRGESGFGSSG